MTVMAIAVSFAMLLSLTSISLGLHRESEERLKESPRDIVISSTGLVPSIEGSHRASRELREDENISAAMPLLTILGSLSFGSAGEGSGPWADPSEGVEGKPLNMCTVGMVGLVPDLTSDFLNEDNELFVRSDILRFDGWFEREGDPFYDGNYSSGWTGEILLDRTLMEENSLSIGDLVYYCGVDGNIRSSFMVGGVVETSLAGSGLSSDLVSGIAVMHLSELQYASENHIVDTPEGPMTDLSTAIYIDLEKDILSPSEQKEVARDISRDFSGLEVTNRESRLYRIEEEVLLLEIFSVSVALSSIFIGVLFLSSIMIIEVEERSSDISIMRSIGISRRTIFLQIVKDSLLLAFFGALFGVLPGYFGSKGIDAYLGDLYGLNIDLSHFEPLLVFGAVLYLFLLVLVFSLVPAFRATTMVPKKGMASHYNR